MSAAFALLSAFLYAVSMVFARVGLKSGSSFAGGVISMGFSFAGSLIIFFYVPIHHFASWAILYFMLAGISGPCIGRFLLFIGINRVGSSVASTIYAVKPLFSAVAAVLILGERLTTTIGVSTLLMVAGLAIVGSEKSGGQIERSWSKKDLIFPLMAGAAYGFTHILRKIGLNISPDPMMGVVAQNAAAISFSLMLTVAKKDKQGATWKNKRAWVFFGLSGIMSVLGQLSIFHALSLGTVLIVSPLSTISPLFVIMMAALFMRKMERVTFKIVMGAVLIVAATALLTFLPQ
ncbi:DMT family transporter [bacterium]|nr:DMT family transporter [bacterium]